jgi:hypothetical protein
VKLNGAEALQVPHDPGIQVPHDIEGHVARSAVRRLVAALFDAWDDGDASRVAAWFAPAARWADPSGFVATGRPTTMSAAFAAWRDWEPWSVHWLSNEQITVSESGRCHGSWLWSAASIIDHGQRAAWSGGDLSVEAIRCQQGWRMESFSMTDRYRSGYEEGWLVEPRVRVPRLEPPREGGQPRATDTPLFDSPTPEVLENLASEVELRSLMGALIADLEEERPPSALSAYWTSDGELAFLQEANETAQGTDEIAALIGRDQSQNSAFMRMLFSESIEATGASATCQWRDLWTGVRDGIAVWLGHRYVIDAVRGPTGWRFQRVERRRQLDCTYAEGWLHDRVHPTEAPHP